MILYIQTRGFYQGRDVSADKIRRKRRDIRGRGANGFVADPQKKNPQKKDGTSGKGKGMQMDMLRIPQICCG